ncbi:MAG: hypothetical protein Kow00124_18900 [Anaerolineae bacterium]
MDVDRLSAESLQASLAAVDAGPFGAVIHYRQRIGSTNDLARELAEAGAPEGTLVIADEQTAGRGRLQRVWEAPPGSSLLMSLIFRPQLAPARAHRLIMVCGLATAAAVESLLPLTVQVKWPNDLHIEGRKVTGILPESAISGDRLSWVIVGMGINVNQVFAPGDPLYPTAISLRMAAGQPVDRLALFAAIMGQISRWQRHITSPLLAEAWRARCTTLGQRIRVDAPGGPLTGLAHDLDEDGALWLLDDAGRRHHLTVGEATILKDSF